MSPLTWSFACLSIGTGNRVNDPARCSPITILPTGSYWKDIVIPPKFIILPKWMPCT